MTIAFDTKTAKTRNRTTPALTFTHTCGAGAKLLVLTIVVDGSVARTGGSPTYNGVTMTQIQTATKAVTAPETVVELWYLLNPGTGSAYTISVPDAGNLYITMEAASFTANAAGKILFMRDSEAISNTSVNPTSKSYTGLAAGDLMVAVVGNGATTWAPTARTGTQLYDVDDGSYGSGAQYFITTGTTNQAISWTFATSEDWALVSGVFREVNVYSFAASPNTSFTLTSVAAHFDRSFPIGSKSLAVTAQGLGFLYQRRFWIAYSTYSLSGQSAALKASRLLKINSEQHVSIVYAGQEIEYSGQTIQVITTNGAAGLFSLVSKPASLNVTHNLASYSLAITQSNFQITVPITSWHISKGIAVGRLELNLSGQSVGFVYCRIFSLHPGTFTLVPKAIAFQYGRLGKFLVIEPAYCQITSKTIILPPRKIFWHSVAHFI